MSFLFPCDDIIDDIDTNHETLSINKHFIIIGYQESQWTNNAPIKQSKFNEFQQLLTEEENITIDDIVYIKYIDIFLWHKRNKIDRINGSGNTQKSEQWQNIQDQYKSHLHTKNNCSNGDDEKTANTKTEKQFKIKVEINARPALLLGEQQHNYRRYRYYWNNPATDIINNGYYEINSETGGKPTKIKIEKALKKSYKKTKLYHENKTFKFLTAQQIDLVYRNHENMTINVLNDTALKAVYRLHADSERSFKKLCVLNVYGENNEFGRNSTIYHSLTRYDYSLSPDTSDEAAPYLYSNTMVYSPNCVIFNDLNANLTPSYLKVNFLTVYPVNRSEYYRIKKKIFDEPVIEDRLKALDDKLNNVQQKSGKKHRKHKNNNKSKKRSEEETAEFIAKLNEMKDKIDVMMRDRIRRMIEIAIYNGCDAVIFSAFGCNAHFGNDAHEIASIFAEFIKTVYFNCFQSVTFVISDDVNGNQRKKRNVRLDKNEISNFAIFQQVFEENFH